VGHTQNWHHVRLAIVAVLVGSALVGQVSTAQAAQRPNVLVIVTDDQTSGTLNPDVMPFTYTWLVAGGRSYPNFTIADPLCCPSRASIMSGRYDHNNGVLSNIAGQATNLDQRSTIQCYLQPAGYLTGIFGKFFNGIAVSRNPLCFDDWATTSGQAHQGLPINVDGTVVTPTGYTDDFTVKRARRFIQRAEQVDGRPWYLYLASTYPHSPYVPRPEHADDQLPLPIQAQGAAVGEADLTDKPDFVSQNVGEIGANQTVENELRMLETVDEQLRAVHQQLAAVHELRRTLVIYVSDNGYLFGEHDLWGKKVPYTESIEVPFAVRFPGHVTEASTDRRFTQNIDIAPTVLAATGTRPRYLYPIDGRNLLSTAWRRPFAFNESFHPAGDRGWQPAWRSLRTASYQYIEWRAEGRIIAREYYDLRSDPWQLVNLLRDGIPGNTPPLPPLHASIVAEASCAGRQECR
jgi:arylsulfatase A-like enzyme